MKMAEVTTVMQTTRRRLIPTIAPAIRLESDARRRNTKEGGRVYTSILYLFLVFQWQLLYNKVLA